MSTQTQDLKQILQVINQVTLQQTLKTPNKFEWFPVQIGQQDHIPYNVIQIKEFHFQENIGFIWYKNLNIPSVEVVLDRSYYDKNFQDFNISAKIFGIRQKVDDKQLIQIQLEGKNELSLQFGECAFNGLKFKDTSSIYKGCKFFLIIMLCKHPAQEGSKTDDNSELLGTAMISPPLHILSRKKAHKERQSHNSLFDPFAVEKLEKKYNQIQNSKQINVPIENNIEGLYHYFTNPRIRCKIFHPLFLLLRFSNAITLYYNQNLISEDQSSKTFVERLQEQIYECLNKKEELLLPEKLMFVCLNTEQEQGNLAMIEKIAKYLRSIEGQVLSFSSYNLCRLPKQFKKLNYSKVLYQNYQESYQKINYLKFTYQQQKKIKPQGDSPQKDMESYFHQKKEMLTQSIQPQHYLAKAFHQSVFVLSGISEQERSKRQKIKARSICGQVSFETTQNTYQPQQLQTFFPMQPSTTMQMTQQPVQFKIEEQDNSKIEYMFPNPPIQPQFSNMLNGQPYFYQPYQFYYQNN